ncbi:MAG: hypothetical protein JW818_04795 [Pirellulales bacterium]|nr:hypothetical protein [Pirellulales bacterium]
MRLYLLFGGGVVLGAIIWSPDNRGSVVTWPNADEARVPAEPDNAFSHANPGYQKRAGTFYEKEYLTKALGQLANAAQLTDEQKTAARKILRVFIDDWLASYVRGGGHISQEDLSHCLARMDKRFQAVLQSASHKAYLIWRKEASGTDNALAFLMSPRFVVYSKEAMASTSVPWSDPGYQKRVKWGDLTANVPQELAKRDLLDWSDELTRGLDTADAERLVVSLEVFLRAGQPERVAKAIPLMAKEKDLTARYHYSTYFLAERMLKCGWHEQARLWFDAFSANGPYNGNAMNRLLEWMDRKEGKPATEAWLREKARREPSGIRTVAEGWQRLYLERLAAESKLGAYVAGLRREIVKRPTDVELVFTYLGARTMLAEAERPATTWLADTVHFERALDNFCMARWFASNRNLGAAVAFYERSLDCPVTDYDRARFNSVSMCSRGFLPEEVEPTLRQWAKGGLAGIFFHEKKLKRAQKLVEELTGKKDGTLADLGPFLFAGMVQAASGQRVVEGRIKQAEKTDKDSIQYWLNRAEYYLGRKEEKQAEHAYQAALKLPPDSRWHDVVGDYGQFLQRHKRYKDAERLYRDEIGRVRIDNTEFWLHRLVSLDGQGGVRVLWDEPLVWAWLEELKNVGFPPTGQMWLRDLSRKAEKAKDWPAFEKKVRQFAAAPSPAPLEYYLGRILHDRALLDGRALSDKDGQLDEGLRMMKVAHARWPKDAFPRADEVANELFRILMQQGDRKAGETLVETLLEQSQYSLNPNWLGNAAVVVAQHGATDLAMRLWKRKTALDLIGQEDLESLASAGLTARLRRHYTALAKKDPENWAIKTALETLKAK